jgi:hypothetical protein
MPVGAFIPAEPDDGEVACLISQGKALSARRAERSGGSFAEGRGARWSADGRRLLDLSARISALLAVQEVRADRSMAVWLRARPLAAQAVLRRLPPASIVTSTLQIADLDRSTLYCVAFYADNGQQVGLLRWPIQDTPDDGDLNLAEFFRQRMHLANPDHVQLVAAARITPERVAELLSFGA